MERNLLVGSVVGLSIFAVCYRYFKYNLNYWSRLGIPGEAPLPLVNDMYNLMLRDRGKAEMERRAKYGKVYGIFLNGIPRVVVSDPEILRQICIKDFDVFPNHNLPHWANKYQRQFLVWLQGDHWKRVRSMMSPTFTSGKIKRMFRFLERCADDLVELIGEQIDRGGKGGVVVNTKDTFGMFTMDGISTCCYGLKLEREKESSNVKTLATRNDFVRAALKIFQVNIPRMLLLSAIPKWLINALGIEMSPISRFMPIASRVEQLIEKRKQSGKKYDDLLQLLVDARLGDQMELDEMDQAENHHANIGDNKVLLEEQNKMATSGSNGQSAERNGKVNQKAELSEEEVLSEAIFLLAAGYETTSTLLTTCTYALAHHPEVQQRLYEEIKSIRVAKEKSEFDYESLTSCRYLDAVISESLRYLAPAPITDRKAEREYLIEKYNIKIPKGFSVLLAIQGVQNDPDYWEEPKKFRPERFLPGEREKIVPGSYMPFSMGPRHCVGMRFSLTEAKIGLAKTVLRYELAPAPGTAFPPELARLPGLISLKKPLIQVKRRVESLNGSS